MAGARNTWDWPASMFIWEVKWELAHGGVICPGGAAASFYLPAEILMLLAARVDDPAQWRD